MLWKYICLFYCMMYIIMIAELILGTTSVIMKKRNEYER